MRKLVLALLSILLLLKLCLSEVSAILCIEKEREALLQLKKSFDDPSDRLASWNNNNATDCCNWDGVACNQTTGHVTKIDLRNNFQVDSFSFHTALSSNFLDSSLFEFKYLNYLDLSWNDFNDSRIPNFLGSMLELRYLNLSQASFYGKVPPHLGNLTKLVVLDLSSNQFYDATLTEFNDHDVKWISHLSSLRFLDLSGINFSPTSNMMQMLTYLPLLSSLSLSFCGLQNIHLSLGSLNSSFLSRIQLLDLSSNNFNGPISPSLGNLSSLEYLDLSDNALTGAIPTSFKRLLNLKELHLRSNRLEELDEKCFVQLENLEVLDISGNLLKGILTEASFSNLSQLHTFYCGTNGHLLLDMKSNWVPPFQLNIFDGGSCISCFGREFPQWLRTQKALVELQLSNMSISSALPTWLRGQKLTTLDLSYNQIVGPLPTTIGDQIPNLKRLFLNDNLINDSIPSFSFKWKILTHLDLSNNQIVGPFPTNIGNQMPQLKYLILNNNLINDSLPPSLCKVKNLTYFDLSHNQIMGPLPTNIGNQMPNLEYLILNNNLINDSLPLSLCKVKNLVYLDLSSNSLSGMVQGCLLTLNLNFLDLSCNKFSGTFPYSHENGFSNVVTQLYLRNNNFEGSMPIVLKNFINLEILDLEENKFFGNIPTWVGDNLRNLSFLRLRGNLFNGTIPASLCNLTSLRILDLADNQLEGSIPSNLNNFDVMTGNGLFYFNADVFFKLHSGFDKNIGQSIKSSYFNYSILQLKLMVNIDFSKNYLTGFIPSEITMLKALIGLNLSHNNLIGIIPTKIGKIESLESLDLSFNQLSGPIPRSISKLNSLGVLELSHNNLSGDIPREGHFSTFNEVSSFDGNPYLCGDPLLVKCAMENPFESSSGMEKLDQEDDKWEKWLLYIMITLGYAIGFWATVGTLILKRSWRYAYFKFMDETKYTRFMQQSGGAKKC